MKFVPCWNMVMLGYQNIFCFINASIYLVKGGRLGLMPGVLFHSCRPSFRHIGVMFPDFAFLTRLGYNGNPLIKAFPAMPNLGFTICHLAFFPWESRIPRVIFILNPRASAPLSIGPNCQSPVATRGNSGLAYRKLGQSGVP